MRSSQWIVKESVQEKQSMEVNMKLSKEMKEVNDKLSKDMKEMNEKQSMEIKEAIQGNERDE
jgi:hypothetical protein